MRGLKDKRVLITGGASGIGAATAARFLEEGSRVCVIDKNAQACEHIKHELPGLGEAIIADVTDLMQVEAAFAEAIRLMDGVDVAVNNAGISIRHKCLEITPEEWDRVIAVNLTVCFMWRKRRRGTCGNAGVELSCRPHRPMVRWDSRCMRTTTQPRRA